MIRPWLFALLLTIVPPFAARAQEGAPPPAAETLVKVTAAPARIAAGGRAETRVHLKVAAGWHVNGNPPSPDYMIPTEVTLAPGHGVRAGTSIYPTPTRLKVGFDDSPVAVFTGDVDVRVPLVADATAPGGAQTLRGKLKFQSCNDQVCLTPATVPFTLQVTVTGGAPAGAAAVPSDSSAAAAPDTTPAPAPGVAPPGGTGFATAPTADAAAVDNPIARALTHGGWVAFLTLFLIGLALNLTPCVYPMLGVTVSIFGARRAVPGPLVVLNAVVYVLGMVVMYSSVGVAAALTGKMFGAMLQNPLVLVGVGVFLIALALSMFGVYELQPPHQLLTKLGGVSATNLAGMFVSGLVVGIFAAPCTGPAVTALLVIVGQKRDPWLGFTTFFTLALGLGAPYLVLGTFSNLLQRMPRSGEWMVWVKKLFGVVMTAIGAFYILLAVAPRMAGWVVPAALLLGGLYLGFLEKSRRGGGFRAVKLATGALAMLAGIAVVATTPRAGMTFQPYSDAAYHRSLSQGRAVILDFSANWCVPCHELERATFTDARVRARARGFDAYLVDLTHYDSPSAEALRQQFAVHGVPTVVFLTATGTEVRAARVEGFLPPAQFLARMELAARGGEQAAR